jgi:hypothetical protein
MSVLLSRRGTGKNCAIEILVSQAPRHDSDLPDATTSSVTWVGVASAASITGIPSVREGS